ncbi:MAG: fimbria major subunit [Bacteroides sp.]|nr:fimbria major subunit [Bacteroides sp.]
MYRGSFWIGTYNNERHVFATPPISREISGTSECKDGWMYYHFAVRDPSETVIEKSYAVVRNHLYKVEVLGLKGWGSGNSREDPLKPIPFPEDDGSAEIRVTVLPWYSVSQSIIW